MSFATVRSTDGYLMVGQTNGATIFTHNYGFYLADLVDFSSEREPNAWLIRETPVRKLGGWFFPVAFESQVIGKDTSPARFTFLAWWALSVIYLVVWLGGLTWWRRRKYRKFRLETLQASSHVEC